MKIPILITLLIISILFVDCVPSAVTPNGNDATLARTALLKFFDALNTGQYSEATRLYGGSYEELIDMNPSIDQTNHAALLKQACRINGFQCLKVRSIVQQKQEQPNAFTFTVEFVNPDGSLFVLNPCCGSTTTDMPPQSTFDFTVLRVLQAGNIFLVQRLPVYTP